MAYYNQQGYPWDTPQHGANSPSGGQYNVPPSAYPAPPQMQQSVSMPTAQPYQQTGMPAASPYDPPMSAPAQYYPSQHSPPPALGMPAPSYAAPPPGMQPSAPYPHQQQYSQYPSSSQTGAQYPTPGVGAPPPPVNYSYSQSHSAPAPAHADANTDAHYRAARRAPGDGAAGGRHGKSGKQPPPPACQIRKCGAPQKFDARGYIGYCSDLHAMQAVSEGVPACPKCGVRPQRPAWEWRCGQTCYSQG